MREIDDLDWKKVEMVMALLLGYRVKQDLIEQIDDVAPFGWEQLTMFPKFYDLTNHAIEFRMMQDYPKVGAGNQIDIIQH